MGGGGRLVGGIEGPPCGGGGRLTGGGGRLLASTGLGGAPGATAAVAFSTFLPSNSAIKDM